MIPKVSKKWSNFYIYWGFHIVVQMADKIVLFWIGKWWLTDKSKELVGGDKKAVYHKNTKPNFFVFQTFVIEKSWGDCNSK